METKFTLLHISKKGVLILLLLLLSMGQLFSQAVPEYMYYKFDAAGNQQNYASAPVGTNPAVLTGMTVGSTGQFGTALVGNGSASGTNRLNTGWATNLTSTGWTISFWVNNFPATSSTTFYYFGDASAGSFRCFTGGVAGNGNLWLRGTGLTDVPINAIPSTPTVIHLVYTGSAVRVFFNGAFNSSVAQGAVNFAGAGPFLVGGYSTSNCINAGTLMDEFRMYNRPLSDGEVSSTWNQSLPVVVGGLPAAVTTAATAVAPTSASLNGTINANNASTTVTFEYGLTTAYGTVVAAVPATVTGNIVTAVTASITGLAPGTTYHYKVCGVNSFGTSCGTDMTFTTSAILPTIVTTAATGISSTGATMNGTVNAGGASTAVTFEYGLTTAYGTTVPGVPATVNGNTVTPVSATIIGLINNTTYHYRIVGVNSVGTVNGLDMTFLTTGCASPGAPGTITGPTNGCGNSLGNVYTVAPIALATAYTWTVPPGSTITAGANTHSITVTFGPTSGNVTVSGSNSCGSGPGATLAITINPAPVPTITGSNSMCVNSGYYYYSTQAGMSNYTWTISSGGIITWGQGTNSIQVTWPTAGSQSVNVNYMNATGCMAGTPTQFPVTVNPVPGSAGTITGSASACGGAAGVAYSTTPILNASTYVWTLPAGATIATGAGTNSITVNFAANASSGNITVYGNNLCGNGSMSTPFSVSISALPSAAGTITGTASVCQGTSGVSYSVTSITGATSYTWTLPAGATIASGALTNSIMVDFGTGASSGVITVVGNNSCGNGTVSPNYNVTLNPVPATPTISLTANNELLSSSTTGNQWYLDGTAIPGATGQSYTPMQSGTYTCIVTLSGCSSAVSNPISVVMTGVRDLSNTLPVLLYPNPNNGRFTLQIDGVESQEVDLSVVNALGVTIFERQGVAVSENYKEVIDLSSSPAGIYWVKLTNKYSRVVKKVIIR
jgi:hypothetical protein